MTRHCKNNQKDTNDYKKLKNGQKEKKRPKIHTK